MVERAQRATAGRSCGCRDTGQLSDDLEQVAASGTGVIGRGKRKGPQRAGRGLQVPQDASLIVSLTIRELWDWLTGDHGRRPAGLGTGCRSPHQRPAGTASHAFRFVVSRRTLTWPPPDAPFAIGFSARPSAGDAPWTARPEGYRTMCADTVPRSWRTSTPRWRRSLRDAPGRCV